MRTSAAYRFAGTDETSLAASSDASRRKAARTGSGTEQGVRRIRQAEERYGHNPGCDWAINPPLPIPPWGNGSADSLEHAKAEFRAACERFYAGLAPESIAHWHHHQDAAKR
jgi:hypothetical protein